MINMLGNTALFVVLPIVGVVVGVGVGFFVAMILSKKASERSNKSASKIIKNAMDEAATAKKEALLEVKEELLVLRSKFDDEVRERRSEVQKTENRVNQREEQLARREGQISSKEQSLDQAKSAVENTKKQVEKNLEDTKRKNDEAVVKLERITGLTKAQAKKEIIDSLLDEAKNDAADSIRQILNEAEDTALKKARNVIVGAMQKLSTDVVNEATVTNIPLPSDEIKGKIIGKEGRNIRAIEMATGVDLNIDDTPEMVSISCFDPYRREIARLSIEKLIHDGRIHPGKIEEIVAKTTREIDNQIKENGDALIYDLKIHNMGSELVKTLGRLKYRTSYGQNMYTHAKEVAHLAGMMAEELGANVQVAKRGGLLHDIGKALDHEIEGTHVEIGVDLARRNKESQEVIHCIEAHHGDVPFNSIEAIIVQIADALSSSRPGARRESSEKYVKRLRELEDLALSKNGVDKVYAIQAGREIRVIVRPDQVDDKKALFLARELAKEIEEKMQYPGQIKVNVIRESRASAIAK